MASLVAFTPPSPPLFLINRCSQKCSIFPYIRNSPALHFSGHLRCREKRASTVVPRAGSKTNLLILAFTLPLSLLVGTVLVSLRIGEKLDQKYFEELAVNEAIRQIDEEEEEEEEDEEDAGEDDAGTIFVEEPVMPQKRNRPVRGV